MVYCVMCGVQCIVVCRCCGSAVVWLCAVLCGVVWSAAVILSGGV